MEMNSSPLTAAQRKRGGGRSSLKTANTTEKTSREVAAKISLSEDIIEKAINRMDSKNKLEIDGAALAISPTSATVAAAPVALAGSGECRRSSRKKIIKFDVRDLLNKHRKPHKIQIEARIDSNAPQTPKATTSTSSMGGGDVGVGNVAGTSRGAASTSDLSSKQKAFMEKSAIFRRMSMSEQQNKIINTPPLPPPLSTIPKISGMLAQQHTITNRKTNVNILTAATIDPAKIAQARRLSRTQEIFNASLMKSKQNSSLIVAQIESNNSCGIGSSGLMMSQTIVTNPSTSTQQKTAAAPTNKRKSVSKTFSTPTKLADTNNDVVQMGVQKRRGRSIKSKVTTTQNSATKSNQKSKPESLDQDGNPNQHTTDDRTKIALKAAPTNTARNWKEYKANLAKSNESLESKAQKRLLTKNTTTQNEDVISEISSTPSIFELEFPVESIKGTTIDIQESPPIDEKAIVTSEPDLIVAAVEEITTDNTKSEKYINAEISDNVSTQTVVLPQGKDDGSVTTTTVLVDVNETEHTEIDAHSTAVTARGSPGSRKSSGSESESGSDRSNKSYKKGDKLRVSLKRLILPEHASTSTISSPSSSINSDSDSRSSPTSSAYNNKSSNSNDDNASTNETAANKVLPTRRSHRFSLKNTAEISAAGRKSQTKAKQNLNESLNKAEKHTTMTTNEVEKTVNYIAMPVDLNALNTTVKTDHHSELSEAEEAKVEEDGKVKNLKLSTKENMNETSEMLMIVGSQVDKFAENNEKQIKDCSKELTAKAENENTQNTTLELTNTHVAKVDNEENANIHVLDEQTPTVSHEGAAKRERRITLPLKKQVSKFKMYEAAVQDVAANVETSTLLDILNTVKQINLTIGTANILEKSVPISEEPQRQFEPNIPNTSTSSTEATNQSTEVNAEMQVSDQPLISVEALPTVTEQHELITTKVDDVPATMPDVALEIELEFENDSKLPKNSNETRLIAAADTISEIIAEVESQNLVSIQPVPGTETITVAAADKYKEGLQLSATAADTSEATSNATQISVENISLEFSTSSPITLPESPVNLDDHSVCSDLSSDKTYDESSSEGTISSKGTRKVGAKKTSSPTPSSDSLKGTKKPTRRYERRSQRGNTSAHKTLEETFAEIAAESSKAVLELKAKQVEVPKEGEAIIKEDLLEKDLPEENLQSNNNIKKLDDASTEAKALTKSVADLNNLELEGNESDKSEAVTTQITSDDGDKMGKSGAISPVDGGKKKEVFSAIGENASTSAASTDEALTTIVDYNLSKSLLEEADNNSNHSLRSRRRHRTRNKKSPTASPTTVAVSQNAKTSETAEDKAIVIERENVAVSNFKFSATEQDLEALIEVVEEPHESSGTTPDHNRQKIVVTPTVELTHISSEIREMSTTGAKPSFSVVSVAEGEPSFKESDEHRTQFFEAESRVQLKELKTKSIKQQQVAKALDQTKVEENIAVTIQSANVTQCDSTAALNKNPQIESLSPTLGKSRKPKRGMSSKLKKSTNTQSEEKDKEQIQQTKLDCTQQLQKLTNTAMEPKGNEIDKVEDLTSEKLGSKVQQAVLEVTDTIQTLTDNALEKTETIFEMAEASKEDPSLTVGEIGAQNVTGESLQQQRVKSITPTDKPVKKVTKCKNTKITNDDKLAAAKASPTPQILPLTAQAVEGNHNVETKPKNPEKAESPGKVRKSRKGKHSPDPNKDNSVNVNIAENDTQINPANTAHIAEAEVEAKDVLAKAPPKKRLLKMQLLYEEKAASANVINNSELPTTSAICSSSATSDVNKPKEKKTKKETKTCDDQATKRSSFDNQTESSLDEESRSANSTPVSKRFKQAQEKTPEEKTKSGSKRKSKWDQQPTSSEKKDNKPSPSANKSEKKKLESHEDTSTHEQAQKMEEKSAKKKRQKKLKEAFEAALNDALNKQQIQIESSKETVTVKEMNVAEKVEQEEMVGNDFENAATTITVTEGSEYKQITTEETQPTKITETAALIEPEEDPDPLKDIEKFIEDGVNLLKRGYKIEDDSVDEVICTKTLLQKDDYKNENEKDANSVNKSEEENEAKTNATLLLREGMITPNESINSGDGGDFTSAEKSFDDSTNNNEFTPPRNLYYETPADTPVATPTSTPPPKSPTNDSSIEEISGVRRSHRIKLITKTPKALVGRGLVREKERFSIKDDVEMKTHYSLDDHLTDLAQVEAKNAKFLKEMEERLSNFQVIKDNEYKCERVISREARKMLCDCFLTAEEEERGELGCGEDCLNRLLMIECGPDCNVKDRCTNNRFQKVLCSPCRVFRTEKKGFGIMADIEILPGEFIMEYVGEVINGDEFEQRRTAYSLDKNRHYYFMALRSDAIIDATIKGNISRFINHSCDPNAETQKWTVNGELRIGFFSRKSIMPGEEITFDYQYQRYGREAQRCYCEAANCRGWIGEEPNSDEGEQIDEDSDALADVSEDDETDDSSAEAEDGQKKLEISKTTSHIEEDGKVKVDIKDKKKKDDADDDVKTRLKKLTSGKSTDKANRKKRKIKEKKAKRMRTSASGEPSKNARYLEDPDIEDEVKFLSRGGLRNQSDTLRFSRLVVRAKLSQTRLNLLKILRNAELPCRRLFLDYHGLRLLHGWMIEDGGDMAIRLALLEALESLPIANKTVLTDSKVYQSVRNWCGNALAPITGPTIGSASSPSDESSKESTSSNSMQQDTSMTGAQEVPSELQKLALKLTNTWNSLPEIFRIPKRERIEQMKEHEREADRQYAEASVGNNRSYMSDRYQRDRFGRGPTTSRYSKPNFGKDSRNSNITVLGSTPTNDPRRRAAQDNSSTNNENMKHLSKEQRREMFAAKVARDEAEKRLAEERREFETKCRFFGLDPKKTRPQDVPFCVDPSTGQWFSVARQAIPTPPCYAHIQVQPKPKSLDPADYKLPAVVATLPRQWKFAITTLGQIYYYHQKQRVPQWNPPTSEQLRAAAEEADSTDSESCEEAKLINESSEDDEILLGMDESKLKAFIDKKIEHRRNKRYNRLVDERPISPRKEEDRIYNQMEMRKYKENKEKIRKRKEDIRRKRAEALKTAVAGAINTSAGNIENLNTDAILTKIKTEIDSDDPDDAIPIQDYLLSSDEEEMMKAECNNSPLLDKIVQGDKIVDELDALTTKRALKRPLPPHRDLSAMSIQSGSNNSSSSAVAGSISGGVGSSGGSEHKRRKSDKKDKSKKSKDSDSKYRRNKEKFRCEIAGIIVQHLKPYRKESCALGRIQSDEDFNHLARKLTHFVMVKELKYCEAVGQTLIVTESVKNKSREFIKKYMAKYGGSYVKPLNDPEFKDIPFTI